MIAVIVFVLILFSFVYGSVQGNLAELSSGLLSGVTDSVSFCLKTGAWMCFFCGIMQVAKQSGITDSLSGILSKPLSKIIPAINKDPEISETVSFNVSSNLLGLGNAATPYGIRAAESMLKRSNGRIDRSIGTFLILNTASVQLIPTTVASVRESYGSVASFDVLLPILITQLVSCTVGVLLIRLCYKK